MANGRIDDWHSLTGARVEIRQLGVRVCEGIVDTVTEDGEILWLQSPLDGRRLFEKTELYEAWLDESRVGFHYYMAIR
ncbi:hypothetical protein [Paenarthrobacter sp. NPDC090522]|uniref:hypothetical protein n=1 Tax=Paenarthrobacter sp. NPDC090522 TaxID=3364383 RepID=UPI003829ABE2